MRRSLLVRARGTDRPQTQAQAKESLAAAASSISCCSLLALASASSRGVCPAETRPAVGAEPTTRRPMLMPR